jgi:hypothetical protein
MLNQNNDLNPQELRQERFLILVQFRISEPTPDGIPLRKEITDLFFAEDPTLIKAMETFDHWMVNQ